MNIATTAIAKVPVIGSIGLAIGQITNQKNEVLKAGDNVYFGDIIKADSKSKSQVLLLDETVITLGEQTSITMDEFVYDPNNQSGKIVSTVLKGSVKVLSGKISIGNPEDLVIKTPAGSIGTRGTEFQTIVDEDGGTSQVLLIGPGENNSLGLRPGAVEVSNELGSVVLDTPFSFTQFSTTTIPSPPIAITNERLEQFQNFLDIGANSGYYSFYFANKFKNLKVYSFEPNIDAYNKFKKTFLKNSFLFGSTLFKVSLNSS